MNYFKIFICLVIFILFFSYNYIVFADDEDFDNINNIDSLISASSNISKEPITNSRAAIIYDRCSKTILFGKKEHEKRKMASTTKIMTAIIVIENFDLNKSITVSSKASGTGGSRLGLHTNDVVTIKDLLYGLLLCSGNDAAVALAESVGGSLPDFAIMMNNKCNELNLNSTHFVTPHGLDNDEHYTTAYELAIITDYALKNDIFRNIVGTKNYTIYINNHPKTISNTNELLGNLNGVYGVKTGFTNGANRCLVTSCKRNDLDIICVVLGCDTKKDRSMDSVKLINYVFNNYSLVNINDIIENDFSNWFKFQTGAININKGNFTKLNLNLDSSQIPFTKIAVKNDNIKDIYTDIDFSYNFTAPLEKSSVIGVLNFYIDDTKYFSVNIVNSNFIERKSVIFYLNNFFENYFDFFSTV